MALLRHRQFGGQLPLAHPQSLPEMTAQVARNCKLWTGALEPLRETAFERVATTPTPPKTIFRYNENTWLEWSGEVDVVRSPVADDAYDRIFYTGLGDYAHVASNSMITSSGPPYPAASYRLGVPSPSSSPGLTKGGTPTDSGADATETRFYTITYVNGFDEEGPPGPVSGEIEVQPGEYVDVGLPGAPTGPYNITQVRIYRTSGELFQYVGAAAVAATTFRDAVPIPGEELPSRTWIAPPYDIEGLISVTGGFFAAFRDNEILFSEVGLPHAWPLAFRMSVDYKVVGLASYNNAVVALTNGVSYILTGADPSAMTKAEVALHQACVSKAGIVTMAGGVVYPSPDGLVYVSDGGTQLVTQGVFARDEWQALKPESMRAVLWEQRYLCFYDTGSATGAFVINPDAPQGGVVFVDAAKVWGRHNALIEDAVYLTIGNEIRRWDAGASTTYTWRGRPDNRLRPDTMGVAQVLADSYPVTVRVYADGALQGTKVITSAAPVRIGGRRRARTYELEIESAQPVYEILLASNMYELTEV